MRYHQRVLLCVSGNNAATGAIDLRHDLKNDPLATTTADGGCSEENSGLVAHQSIVRIGPVTFRAKLMRHALLPLAA